LVTLARTHDEVPEWASLTNTSAMPTARDGLTSTLLPNGEVLVTGGRTTSTELYQPGNGIWVAPGEMSQVRTGRVATSLANGQILAAGGSTSGCCVCTKSAELYVP
jgi:hypothetical protein